MPASLDELLSPVPDEEGVLVHRGPLVDSTAAADEDARFSRAFQRLARERLGYLPKSAFQNIYGFKDPLVLVGILLEDCGERCRTTSRGASSCNAQQLRRTFWYLSLLELSR